MHDWNATWKRIRPRWARMSEGQLATALSVIWQSASSARERDAYDRTVGVRAAYAAQTAFMGGMWGMRADYRGVSRGLAAVLRYLDTADEGAFTYAGPTAAVGSTLREVIALLAEERPEWLARPRGVPHLADRWMNRSVVVTPEACHRAGRTNEARIGYAMAALSRWRRDCSAWATLNRLHHLHDGVFDEARAAFESADVVIRDVLSAKDGAIDAVTLRCELKAAFAVPTGLASEAFSARQLASQFLMDVVSTLDGRVEPRKALQAVDEASFLRVCRKALTS